MTNFSIINIRYIVASETTLCSKSVLIKILVLGENTYFSNLSVRLNAIYTREIYGCTPMHATGTGKIHSYEKQKLVKANDRVITKGCLPAGMSGK